MAKQILNQYPFNAALNTALKDRFGAKWDKAANAWTVGTKAKAEQANALIKEVVEFEKDKMIQAGEVEFHNRFNETHPGYLGFHPLTGATWNFIRAELWARAHGLDRAAAKADLDALKQEMGIQ